MGRTLGTHGTADLDCDGGPWTHCPADLDWGRGPWTHYPADLDCDRGPWIHCLADPDYDRGPWTHCLADLDYERGPWTHYPADLDCGRVPWTHWPAILTSLASSIQLITHYKSLTLKVVTPEKWYPRSSSGLYVCAHQIWVYIWTQATHMHKHTYERERGRGRGQKNKREHKSGLCQYLGNFRRQLGLDIILNSVISCHYLSKLETRELTNCISLFQIQWQPGSPQYRSGSSP